MQTMNHSSTQLLHCIVICCVLHTGAGAYVLFHSWEECFFFFFSCLTELTSVTSCNCSNFSGLIQKWEILEGILVFSISGLGEKNIVIVLACQLTSAMMHAAWRRWRNVMIIKHRNSGSVTYANSLFHKSVSISHFANSDSQKTRNALTV